MLWSELPLERVRVELAKLGTTVECLILDARDVPELQPVFLRLALMSLEERLRVALVWFGDEGNPQPEQRTPWKIVGRTPAWGRLPRLDAEEPEAESRGAKPLGVPERELLWIIERRLENGERASRKWLADETRRREELTYVPRKRLTPLVDWIDAHPEAARRVARLRVIPPDFRAGQLGPVPPQG